MCKMKINVPNASGGRSSKEINTVIPDAYQIDLTLTGLNPESKNFMLRSLGDPVININES